MSDDLRSRIAAALVQHHTAEDRDCKWPLQCECDAGWRSPEEWARHVADAVIRELGWKQQWRADLGYDGYSNCPSRDQAAELVDDFNSDHPYLPEGEQGIVKHRYVTEWTAE